MYRSSPVQSPISKKEAMFYYRGLPSNPCLVARSSSPTIPWVEPSGPEAYPQRKELKNVGNHPIRNIWEDTLAPSIIALLDLKGVKFTSIDVVRIGIVDESSTPVILWIGVIPASLLPVDGLDVALKCKGLLEQSGIFDVHVEFRESITQSLAGLRFLEPALSGDPTVELRRPLTATLGFSVSAETNPHAEGTAGFFMAEGGDSKKTLLVTTRHVVIPPEEGNSTYEYKNSSAPLRKILLLSDKGHKKLLASIDMDIEDAMATIEYSKEYPRPSKGVEEGSSGNVTSKYQVTRGELVRAEEVVEQCNIFRQDVLKDWKSVEALGHLLFTPPIEVGTNGNNYTKDFAVIELDLTTINAQTFKGNVIDLGTHIKRRELMSMMHPHGTDPNSFTYPSDRLLTLHGIITTAEMFAPTMVDHNGNECLMALKRGCTTGLTVGCANEISSHTRRYFEGQLVLESREWAILPQNNKSGAFSKPGDSSAVVVDGRGRIGGILTGGAGIIGSIDITYVTPIEFLEKCIKEKFPKAHFNPVFTA